MESTETVRLLRADGESGEAGPFRLKVVVPVLVAVPAVVVKVPVVKAPAWPVKSRVPLKVVLVTMLPISACRATNSACRAARSALVLVPLAACTASVFMRCRMSWISLSAPSATFTSEMPSWMLRAACWPPRTCASRFSEIDSPAASSEARLTRSPELRRSRDLDMPVELADMARSVLNADTFVLMRSIGSSLNRHGSVLTSAWKIHRNVRGAPLA
ncbi:hypothetical protein D3C72_1550870 [compost metagenome]